MKVHIAIVSDQVLANLIPALMDRPDKVVLVCSAAMQRRGLDRRLARLLAGEAIAAEIRAGAPDVGLREIHEYALGLVDEIKAAHPSAEIVLNATGGTKLMSLGFVEIFRGDAQRILYTDTAHRRIEFLPTREHAETGSIPMTNVLDVPRYLAAQGFRFCSAVSDSLEWRVRAAGRKAACKYLGKNAAQIQDLIGALNALADQALAGREELVNPDQRFQNVPYGRWAEALGQLCKASLLRWQDGSPDVTFIDSETARFLHGGWLEEYAWHIAKDEAAHDARLSVKGAWEGAAKSENQFDVLACHGNQLLFIECKTLRHQEETDSELAYKVDSLGQDARGLFGETWLLSAREPSAVLHERARQSRIRLIGPHGLRELRKAMQEWLGGLPRTQASGGPWPP